jgi:hypothetical protein
MAALHRTPLHHQVAGLVRDGRVKWRLAVPAGPKPVRSEGFTPVNGGFYEHHFLVALYELMQHKLIEKRGERVTLTDAGRARLAEWDATRTGSPR